MPRHGPPPRSPWVDALFDALYSGSGLADIASPWLRVFVLVLVFAVLLSLFGAAGAWIIRTYRSRIVDGAVALLMMVLVAVSGLTTAMIFGHVGQTTGLGRDPWFLAYWVALLVLGVLPCGYLMRKGVLKKK